MIELRWNEQGLIPVVVQDAMTNAVLMQAYMNEESLRLTLDSGYMVYFSRSRQSLWKKGETSGQTQRLVSIHADCDADCLLAKVEQNGGGACHTGAYSCFFEPLKESEEETPSDMQAFFDTAAIIRDRKAQVHVKEGSYTRYLFDQGIDKILKKVAEECAETIIAAKNNSREEIVYETSDLFYHILVMLEQRGVPVSDIMTELRKRQKS
jgi:phosphoribosyl-ATP pyrophosphohydrolase/phosphoribosyl-AMP cyclohydrolase